jgi:cellulase/cellobiase CelA1
VPTRAPAPTIRCSVTYALQDQWNPGFIGGITLTNAGPAPLSGWTLRFTFTDGQKMTSFWSGIEATQTGRTVTMLGTSEHTTLAAASTIELFVQGTWKSSDAPPTAFTLDGTACS